ncbi:hypothetical protein D3C79_49880 [compost metagenome]
MGKAIKGWLFLDRVRSMVTFFAVLIGLGLLAWQTYSPKPVKLEAESFNAIKEATEAMRRTAQLSEQIVKDNEVFTAGIKEMMQKQADLREANYDFLMGEYGTGDKPPSYDGGPPPDFGLHKQPLSLGGLPIYPDPGGPDRVQHVRVPVESDSETANGSSTGVSGGSSPPPSVQGGRSDKVVGAE